MLTKVLYNQNLLNMQGVKILFLFCFITFVNGVHAQFNMQQYDSIVIGYYNYLSDTYYMYTFSHDQLEIRGEKTFYKRVIVDSSRWEMSYSTDVRKDNRCVRLSDAYTDSLNVLVSGFSPYVSPPPHMYTDVTEETDNLVIVFTGYGHSGISEWRMILCPICEHIQIVDRIVKCLEGLQHL